MENKAFKGDSWRRSFGSPEILKDREMCMSVDGELMKRQDDWQEIVCTLCSHSTFRQAACLLYAGI